MSDTTADRPTAKDADATSQPVSQEDVAAAQAEAALDARDDAVDAGATPDGNRSPDASASITGNDAAGVSDIRDDELAAAPSATVDHDAPVDEPASAPAARNNIPVPAAVPVQQQPATQTYQAPPSPQQPVQQPAQPRVFTPPPVAPKKKGNRIVGTLIAAVSVVVFLALYAIVAALIIGVQRPGAGVLDVFTAFATSPIFVVPAIFFVIGFVIVVLLVNRANWWAYVVGSLFVAALVYFGTIGVGLLIGNVVALTPAEAAAEFARSASNPFIIAAALVAREVTMWIGAAISARGRRMKARNITARQEYEQAAEEHRAEYERGYASA